MVRTTTKRLGFVAAGITSLAIPLFFLHAYNLPMHGQNSYVSLSEGSKPELKTNYIQKETVKGALYATNPNKNVYVSQNQPEILEVAAAPNHTEVLSSTIKERPTSDHTNHVTFNERSANNQAIISPPSPSLNTATSLSTAITERRFTVQKGDTLISMLREAGISTKQINKLIFSSSIPKKTFDLKLGQEIYIKAKQNALELMKILPKDKQYTEIRKSDQGLYSMEIITHPEVATEEIFSFIVTKNLTANAKNKGLTESEIALLNSVYSEKLNLSKLNKNTIVSTIFIRKTYNGHYFGDSELLAASITTNGSTYSAYQWKDGDNVDYFDENGINLKNTFRRHPVDNVRITSSYNPKRLHPVLKITRPHRGTDYAGSRQPIRAIGDGKIYFAGKKGSFGNTVIIRHGSYVQTLSAHMHKIATGIRKGAKVKKGQIIGYIGSTGVVTGPHLHFEMKVKGQYVNSVKANLATNESVKDKDAFIKAIRSIKEKLPST